MLESWVDNIKYINHFGEVLYLDTTHNIYINMSDIHNYVWDHSTRSSRISKFYRGEQTRTLPIFVACSGNTEEEMISDGLNVKNIIVDITDKDVLSMEYGSLYVGDWYMRCFITASVKGEYIQKKNFMKADLEVTTDRPEWLKVESNEYGGDDDLHPGFLDYPHDYLYDYTGKNITKKVTNDSYTPCRFKLIIYGHCNSPRISVYKKDVGTLVYGVNDEILQGERLVIDSMERKVYKISLDGSIINEFNSRTRDNDIFQPMPDGEFSLKYPAGEFRFNLTLYPERSEPIWT